MFINLYSLIAHKVLHSHRTHVRRFLVSLPCHNAWTWFWCHMLSALRISPTMGNCILNDAAHIPQPSTCILCPFPTINFSYIYWQVNHRFACYLVAAVGVFCGSALSSDFNSLNKPAASRIRLNSIQKACTSMKISYSEEKKQYNSHILMELSRKLE